MRLSEHFTLAEFTKSQTAARHGIINVPDDGAIEGMKALCTNVLEPVRRRFGTTVINSGFRCLELNTRLGSKDTSQHVKGEAADIECPGTPNIVLARWIEAELKFDQLILEYWEPQDPTAGWVHVSYSWTMAPHVQRGEVLTKKARMPYITGLPSG